VNDWRTIRRDISAHPVFRRHGYVVKLTYEQMVFMADDEGRFINDTLSIFEAAFARCDPVTEEQVVAATELLVREAWSYFTGTDLAFCLGGSNTSEFRSETVTRARAQSLQ
jgi:hypothetical protein